MQNETFSTRDIYLASTLLSLKFSLIGIDRQIEGMRNQTVGYFNFQLAPKLEEVEKKYWGRRLAVEPTDFINNLYKLKSEVTNSPYREPIIDITSRDIHFAATLLTLKFDLKNISFRTEGPRNQLVGYFEFSESPQLDKTRQEYLDGTIAIEPILFISNLRGLKSQLTNQYKNPYTNQSVDKGS